MSLPIHFVTSFGEKGWKTYARSLLDSVKYWDPSFSLTVFHNGLSPETLRELPRGDRYSYEDLDQMEALQSFRMKHAGYDGKSRGGFRGKRGTVVYNFRFDALRFAYKSYAVTEKAFALLRDLPEGRRGWLIWLDADTVTHRPFSYDDLTSLLPEEADIVHLARTGPGADYTETCFVAYRLDGEKTPELLKDYRWIYDSGEILKYREWHDCFGLDRLIAWHSHKNGLRAHNLNPFPNETHIFEKTPLASFLRHDKGDRKYAEKSFFSLRRFLETRKYNKSWIRSPI